MAHSDGGAIWPGIFGDRRALVELPELAQDDTPVFERIAQVLAAAIADKKWAQGDRFPPAASIAARYNTSVDTARAALAVLIQRDLLYRKPGGAAYVRGTLARPVAP